MIYIFGTLIVVALAGISYVVLKYYKPNFGKKNAKIGGLKGEEFWLNLIQDNPKNPYPYKKLGEWYVENKQKADAAEVLRHALKLDPKDGNIKRRLAELEK